MFVQELVEQAQDVAREELENLRNAVRPSLWRRVNKIVGLEALTVPSG